MHVSPKIIAFLTLCSTASSFSPNRPIYASRKLHHRVNLSERGWDNNNFLDALGGGKSTIDDANAKYQKEAEARSVDRERRFQSMAHDANFEQIQNDDEQPDFMMQNNMPNQSPPTPTMPQQPQQAPMDPQAYYQALQAWQQAMVAFQQFSAEHPQAAAQMTAPPPPPPPVFTATGQPQPQPVQPQPVQPQPVQPVPQQQYQAPPPPQQQQPEPIIQATDSTKDDEPKDISEYLPKRAGGNKDAYEVNNSADVYFAQLKRDSYVRAEARKQGNLEIANAPFAEKGVKALSGILSDELVARRREQVAKNGGEFETSRDEMILPSHFEPTVEADKTYTGVSYKERLMQAKKNRRQG